MRVAGVRLADGDAVWAEAGTWALMPLDRVTVRRGNGLLEGEVFVAPEQLIRSPASVEVRIVALHRREPPGDECNDLPGVELPPLGTEVTTPSGTGRIGRIDPVRHLVTVEGDDGQTTELSVEQIQHG